MTDYERIPKALAQSPEGLCKCGCGQQTPIAPQTRTNIGHVRGQHIDYCVGHNRRKSPVEYIEQDMGYETPCWIWQRCSTRFGYGMLSDGTQMRMAHRLYYERLVGPIAEGLDLDHLCRNRGCVNPAHLEPVTPAENSHRGLRSKLSMEKARDIRARHPAESVKTLMAEYGVGKCTIYRLLAGKSWWEEGE